MTRSWPDRFVYVCTATKGGIVNIAPMLNAGPARVVGLLVLRAVNDLEKLTETEKSNAILPGERLMEYAKSHLDLEPENMGFIDGKPDSFTDWTDVLPKASQMAAGLNAEIVFNITGGPKPVVLGTLLGAGASGQNAPITMISFGHNSVSKKAFFDASGQLIEEFLPVDLNLGLSDYLKSVGLTEIGRAAREKKERRMTNERSSAEIIFQKILEMDREIVIPKFRSLISAVSGLKYRDKPLNVPLFSETRVFFADVFDKLNNTKTIAKGIEIRSEYDLEFLQGKWLESKVFNMVSEILKGRNNFEIACGLDFGLLPSGATSKQVATISDFDLVILGDDRVEVIESKAVVDVKQIHAAIAKLNSHIRTLGGDAGRAWIVAPLLDKQQLDKNDMIASAQELGIKLLFGRNSLDELEREIRKSRRL